MSFLGFDLIIRLPECLSCCVLSEWIQLKSLARLDSAFCNRSQRSRFLNLIRGNECVCTSAVLPKYAVALDWMTLRDVKVEKLVCSGNCDGERLTEYLLRNEKFVRSVVLCEDVKSVPSCNHLLKLTCSLSHGVCSLLRANPLLQRLEVTGGVQNAFCGELEQISLPELSSLRVAMGKPVTMSRSSAHCLLGLVRMSTCLLELHLYGISFDMDATTYLAIAHQCPQLHTLSVDCSNIGEAILVEFTRLCPHITTLRLQKHFDFYDAGVLGVVRNLPNLKVLSLLDCEKLTDTCLEYVSQYCAGSLEELYVGCSIGITHSTVERVRTECSKLRVCKFLRRPLILYLGVEELHAVGASLEDY